MGSENRTGSLIELSLKQGEAFYYLDDDPIAEIVFFGGGAGGGKSYCGCLWQLTRRLNYPNTAGLIGRNVLSDLKDTTLETMWRVMREMNLKGGTHYTYNKNDKRITFFNGSKIFLRELKETPSDPDFEDLGSLELTDAFVDEVTEITEKAVNILKSRIRFNLIKDKPALLLTGNPSNNWVRWRFVHEQEGKRRGKAKVLPLKERYIQALVDDNPDKKFAKIYKGILQDLPDYDRMRLLEGVWGIREKTYPFFQTFDERLHVSDFKLKPNLDEPLWISFDFNINPTTAIIGQRLDDVGCRIYDVIQRIGTEETCISVMEHWGKHPSGFYITGDHSGHSGSSAMGTLPGGQYHTDFEVIKETMRVTDYDLIDTRKANPRYEYSRRLLHHFFQKVPFLIDGTNVNTHVLVEDLNSAKVLNGKLYKDRGQGHPQDAGDGFRYLVHGWFQGDFSIIEEFAGLFRRA